jgi:DNA-directed RNA polymerase specialized sigma24 family protein
MILDDMTLTEVAAQDGCHYNTAQQSFHRALKKLRKYMEKSSKLR